jgi:two-component system, cell cycle response regulator DivK
MPERILVVEDDERSRRLLKDVLTHHGYDVAAFGSAEAALDDAAGRCPAMALLDIQLPGLSGYELLPRLRLLCGAVLPALAVTASVMDADRRRIVEAGFDAYVAKPVNIRQLLDLIASILRSRK